MKRRLVVHAVLTAGLASASLPATAQVALPPPADANDRALLPEVGALLGSGHADLAHLDGLLARLPRPTPLRGIVQLARASELDKAQRTADAAKAAEEAVRLLPALPEAKLMLSAILTFTGEPRRAADLWLEASRQSPDVVRDGDRYMADALIGRLLDLGDRPRADAMRARMAEIGFVATLTPDSSDAAVAQIYRAMAQNDVGTAKTLLPTVSNPEQMAALWTDKRFAALWPEIDQAGGPSLGRLHVRYFSALRREWQRGRNLETATNYARLLASARQYASVVSLFRPLIDRVGAEEEDPHLWFLVPVVARSLAELGKPDEGRALLDQLGKTGGQDPAMRLNATGNLANLSFLLQRWDAAVTESAEWLTIAQSLGPAINRSAVLTVSALRACALTKSGHASEAAPLVADINFSQRAVPQPALTYSLCTGDVVKGRMLLVDRLRDEATRPWALALVQPVGPSADLPEEIAEAKVMDSLRADPAVRAAAAAVGRILPQAIAVGLPPGFDPDGSDAASRPHPDSI